MTKTQSWFFILAALTAGLVFGFLLPQLIELVVRSGHSIGAESLGDDYLRAVVWSLVLGLVLLVIPFPRELHRPILWLWLARCLVTLFFMLAYESNYELDAYYYYRYSLNANAPDSLGIGQGSLFITWIAWIINQSLPFTSSYHTLKIFFSFAGLMGALVYYQIYFIYTRRHNMTLLIVLGTFPSMIFWSSILGKDPITYLAIGLFALGGLMILKRGGAWGIACLALGGLMILMVRFWLLGILSFALLLTALWSSHLSFARKLAIGMASVFALGFMTQTTANLWNLGSMDDVVYKMDTISKQWGRGGSANTAPSFGSPADMAAFVPVGVFTSLFRPMPGEVMNAFGLLAGVENLILLAACLYVLFQLRRTNLRDGLVFFSLAWILSWAVIYGFISYQNLGTASRFKLQVLPFMVILPFYLRFLNGQKTGRPDLNSAGGEK